MQLYATDLFLLRTTIPAHFIFLDPAEIWMKITNSEAPNYVVISGRSYWILIPLIPFVQILISENPEFLLNSSESFLTNHIFSLLFSHF